jgi:hypothetical protein
MGMLYVDPMPQETFIKEHNVIFGNEFSSEYLREFQGRGTALSEKLLRRISIQNL